MTMPMKYYYDVLIILIVCCCCYKIDIILGQERLLGVVQRKVPPTVSDGTKNVTIDVISKINTTASPRLMMTVNKMAETLRTGPLFYNNQPAASLTAPPLPAYDDYQHSPAPSPTPPSPKTSHFEWETLLVRKLFNKRRYNPQVRPAVSDKMPVEVSIELVLLQINEMIEKDQEIVISGFMKIKWRDVRLVWNSDDFGGIDWIVTESANCWLPDLALINSNDVYAVTRDMRFPLTLNATGDILYVPAGKIYARCELDLKYFPFDFQLCKYRFESWAYASELVRITGLNFTIEPEHYMQNPEWEIPHAFVRTEIVHYESYNFSRVDFFMVLKRRSLFFITYTIFPCVALSVLQLLSHTLPFTEPERINFATTTLIAFSVFHVSIVEQMPHGSDAIPLLAIFVDSLMVLIGLSLVECFLMMNWLSKVGLTVPSPRWWYYLVDRWGDYMWLGSAGNYWRRNYLYVYERLNHKLDTDRRRRELERQRWASAGYQYKLRRGTQAFTKGDANFEALLYLVEKSDRQKSGRNSIVPPSINFSPAPPSGDEQPSNSNNNNNNNLAVNFCESPISNHPSIKLSFAKSGSQHSNLAVQEEQPLISRPVSLTPNNVCHSNQTVIPNYDAVVRDRFLESNNEQLIMTMASSTESLQHFVSQNSSLRRFWNRTRSHKESGNKSPPAAIGMVDLSANKGHCKVISPAGSFRKRSSSSYRKRHHHHHHHHPWKTVSDSNGNSKTTETSMTGGSAFTKTAAYYQLKEKLTPEEGPLASPETFDESTGLLNNFSQHKQTHLNSPKQRRSSEGAAANLSSLTVPQPCSPRLLRNSTQRLTVIADSPNSERSYQFADDKSKAGIGQYHRRSFDYTTDKNKQYDVRNFVEEISTHISNHELRNECTGIWTTFITVVDRILSIFLCLLSVSLLSYLFVWFPEPPNLSKDFTRMR